MPEAPPSPLDDSFAPREARAPVCVRTAIAVLRVALAEDPAARPTVAHLARKAGVTPRTLERHFARAIGMAPRAVAMRLRLAAARRTLSAGEASSVLDAALRHGFAHPGRFSMDYARAFGEPPSVTLRAVRHAASRQPAAPAKATIAIELRLIDATTPADVAKARRTTDELAAAICRRRDLTLGDRSSGPPPGQPRRYRLQGTLDGNAIFLELIHPARRSVVWTGRQSLARRQRSGWAERCIENVRAVIEAEQVAAARHVPRHHADADTLFARARPSARSMDVGGIGIALDLLNDALHRDPAHARAHALTGWCLGHCAIHHFTRDAAAHLQRVDMHAARALALAPDDPEVLTMVAAIKTYNWSDLDAAERLSLASLALDPDQPDAWRRLAWLPNYRGDWRRGLDAFRQMMHRWPHGYDGALSLLGVGVASFATGDYARSARALSRAIERQPSLRWAHRYLTPAAIHAGATDIARRSVETLRRGFPDLRISDFARLDILRGEALVRMQEGHARAGMPP